MVGNSDHPHPKSNQRQVEHQQHEIANPHRCDQPRSSSDWSVITEGPGWIP